MSRQPVPSAPERIAALATLPVFHKLKGRRVLLVGASEGARWKAELLAATGADLALVAGGDIEAADRAALEALAASIATRKGEGFGSITLIARDWRPEDIAGAALAIADLEDEAEARNFFAAARAAGVPVNLVDKPQLCDFQFGAIVNRSPLVVSISTDGAAPVFGQAIRAKIEALLPRGLAGWAGAARDWREAVQAARPGYALRRRFWERFTSRALANPDAAPTEADRRALLQSFTEDLAVSAGATAQTGSVALVGAGPGDPDLLTIKAMRTLQSADIILYDDLVSTGVLELARREAQRMLVGKKGHGPSCKQSEINDLMVKLALQGKRVVRLKGGDPLVFGRASEEIEACREHGIPVEIVPGISAAQGAAAALGVSLTERGVARRLQLLTGHGEEGALPATINWAGIADPEATTVVYMPKRTLGDFAARAVAAGLDPATPASAIANATRPDQQVIDATLATLDAAVKAAAPEGPVLVMIGRVLRDRLSQTHRGKTEEIRAFLSA
jgi:uroporphyrin-III C-methyltransferase/precorrin-2 dehydrogenase/sirohydrochlorin ferrochelatase